MAEQEEQQPVLRLASASPRRRQLLELIGVPHVVTPADIDETAARRRSRRRSTCCAWRATRPRRSAHAARGSAGARAPTPRCVVDGEILGKPRITRPMHSACCGKLSGRTHEVHHRAVRASARGSAIAGHLHHRVSVRDISRAARCAPTGRAASRRARPARMPSRGSARCSSTNITGSYTGVMGLPLFETAQMLRSARHCRCGTAG